MDRAGPQSGKDGSSPQSADPAALALADPALLAEEEALLIVALSAPRWTTRSPTTVPA